MMFTGVRFKKYKYVLPPILCRFGGRRCKTHAPTKLALFPFVPLVLEAPITTISGSVRDATLQYSSSLAQ